MNPEKEKEFEKEFRKFKKELKKIVNEVNYPHLKMEFEVTLSSVRDYPRREEIYKGKGWIK